MKTYSAWEINKYLSRILCILRFLSSCPQAGYAKYENHMKNSCMQFLVMWFTTSIHCKLCESHVQAWACRRTSCDFTRGTIAGARATSSYLNAVTKSSIQTLSWFLQWQCLQKTTTKKHNFRDKWVLTCACCSFVQHIISSNWSATVVQRNIICYQV